MTQKLTREGWYLLSGINNQTCKNIINTYNPASYLDISAIYIPLYKDLSSTVFNSAPNDQVTDISVSDLVFNETIGTILGYDEYKPKYFGRVIDFSNVTFSESVGFWVYMYQIQTNPVLHLTITNDQVHKTTGYFRPILSIDGTDTTSKSSIQLDFSRNDISINLIVERTFPFNYNNIFTSVVVSDNDYTSFNGTSGNNDKNDISFINFTGTYRSLSMTTTNIDNSGQIIFTVINSTPDNNERFNVIVNIDVSDTIFPRIQFQNRTSPVINYTYLEENFRGNQNENTFNTTIKLNQSYIQSNPGIDLSPYAVAYDQTSSDSSEARNITKTYTLSNIPDPNNISNIILDISYTPGEWRPGTYKIRYLTTDNYKHETIVDVSFEIVDNICPIITVSNDTINNISSYTTTQSLNYNYNNNDIQSGQSSLSGIGYTLTNEFISTTNQTSDTYQNLYIYYSDVSSSSSTWLFPIVTQKLDFSNIDISLTNVTISNISSNINIDTSGITNVALDTTVNTYNTTTSLVRKYELKDYYNLYSRIYLKVYVYDDTIPIVDVSFIHTIFKIDTSTSTSGDNNVYGNATSILVNNVIQSNPIVISLYDNITFNFAMNKVCQCSVKCTGSLNFNLTTSDYQLVQSINLTQIHTIISGEYTLVFTIWDKNYNFYKFKYDISINDIPSYTLQIIEDQHESDSNKKQKIVLRVADRTNYQGYLAFFAFDTSDNFSNTITQYAALYDSNTFGFTPGNYGKAFDSSSKRMSFSVNNSSATIEFNSNSINTGIYYELIYFPSTTPMLNIQLIQSFLVDNSSSLGTLALAKSGGEIKSSIGFYKNITNTIFYNT